MKNTNSYLSPTLISLTLLLILVFSSGCSTLDKRRVNPLKALINKGQYEESVSYIDKQLHEIKAEKRTSKKDEFTWLRLHYWKGRILEHRKEYEKASQIYIEGLHALNNSSEALKKDSYYYNLKGLYLYCLCHCYIQLGNYDRVYQLTEYALKESDDEESRRLLGELDEEERGYLMGNLAYIHIICTGDSTQYFKILKEGKKFLNKEKKKISSFFRPLYYITQIMTSEAIADMVLVYSKMQSGNLKQVYNSQKKLEGLYENIFIRILMWGGQTLGIYKEIRAMMLGLGGYGYSSFLGKYQKGQYFLLEAMNCWNYSSPAKPPERMFFGGLQLAYADAFLIPMKENPEVVQFYLDKGMRFLELAKDEWLDISSSRFFWMRSFLKAYGLTVSSKFNYIRGNWQQSYLYAEKALNFMDRASPKILIIDATYFAFLSALKHRSIDLYEPLYDEALDKLLDYNGFEMWKMHYAESLLHESKGNLHKALTAAEKSVASVEKFWENRFPDMTQQVTFMEDKGIPYQRIIELLLRPELKSENQVARVFEYMEKVKINSLRVSKGEDDSAVLRTAGLREIQENLSADEAVVALYYGTDYLISLLISDSEVSLEKSGDIGADKINRLADEFSESISYRNRTNEEERDYVKKGYDLFSALMGCHYKAGRLAGKKRVYIVPHRKLHYVAWNALSMSEDNIGSDYLTDSCSISVLPAASAVLNPGKVRPGNSDRSGHCSAFFIGSEIEYYPSTVEEIRKLGCCTLYTGKKATVGTVLEELENKKTGTLILYAHGRFDRSSPFESYIMLGGRGEKHRLTLAALDEAEIASRFVVLAGCATGTIQRHSELNLKTQEEKFSEADDLLGLYKTLFSKGADRVVISVIKETSKHQTELFLLSLAEMLDRGGDEKEAFRKSVHSLREKYPHPYYWGGYVLIGK